MITKLSTFIHVRSPAAIQSLPLDSGGQAVWLDTDTVVFIHDAPAGRGLLAAVQQAVVALEQIEAGKVSS